jgi:hypothetical protein
VVIVRGSKFSGKKEKNKRPLPAWGQPNQALNNMQVTAVEWGGGSRDWHNELYYRLLVLFFGSPIIRGQKYDVAIFLREKLNSSTTPSFLPEHVHFLVGLLDVPLAQLLDIYNFGTLLH